MNRIPIIGPGYRAPVKSVERAATCSTCRYRNVSVGEMFCRHDPPMPAPILVMTQTGPQLTGSVSLWPKVMPDHWCGRHPDFGKDTTVVALAPNPPDGAA